MARSVASRFLKSPDGSWAARQNLLQGGGAIQMPDVSFCPSCIAARAITVISRAASLCEISSKQQNPSARVGFYPLSVFRCTTVGGDCS
jgi:hypothetical protein